MTKRQSQALTVFRKRYPLKSAGAIVGNLSGESGNDLNSTVFRVHADHGSGGIAEWRLERLTNMIDFAHAHNADPNDLEIQCEFLMHELDTDPRYVGLNAQLLNPRNRTIDNLTANFCEIYERPAKSAARLPNRIAQANKVVKEAQATGAVKGGVVVAAGSAGGAGALHAQNMPEMLVLALIAMAVIAVVFMIAAAWQKEKLTGLPRAPASRAPDSLARLKQISMRLAAISDETKQLLAEKDKVIADVKVQAEELDHILAGMPLPTAIEYHETPKG
jgi:Phage tail lysozyme